MERVIIQPVGSKGKDEEHYQNTIVNPVTISRIENFEQRKEHIEKLKNIYGENGAYVWGVTPSEDERNLNYWKEIESGYKILFSGGGKIFASATVTHKLRNEKLAEDLWGSDEKGRTWEFIYFIDEIKKENISYERFNRIVGYKPNYIPRGFMVIDEERSLRLLETLELRSNTFISEVEKEDVEEGIEREKEFEGSVDVESTSIRRKEQGYLRKKLFSGSKYSECGICKNKYPVRFLYTSHIKKRSECTEEEKKDLENIAMPMCKFGCDDLYEEGYITVKDGKVERLIEKPTTESLDEYLENIIGNECKYWNENTKKYFKWHKEYHTEKG